MSLSIFLEKILSFSNVWHNALIMSIVIDSIIIPNIHSDDNYCIPRGIKKSEAINLFKNDDLSEKGTSL